MIVPAGERPLRVLWVAPTIGAGFGGPTSTIVNGVTAENRAGIASELATTIGSDEAPEAVPAVRQLRENGIEARLFRRTRLFGRGEAWGLSRGLVWWLFRNIRRYDVVHLQYVWCLTSIFGAIAARLGGVPIVVTPHESLTEFDIRTASRNRLLRLLKRILRHLYLRTADQLILMSRLEERDTRCGNVPVIIVTHAVLETAPVSEVKPASTNEGLQIGFFGRFIRKKGVHLLVEALARNRDRAWRLAIAGPVGEQDYFDRTRDLAADLGVSGRIEWLGYVPSRRLFLERCDVLAMPSVYEGFGMVAAEAMCSGIPVVVPRQSGVAELVEDYGAGVVMKGSSVSEVEAGLLALDESAGLRQTMGENGLRAAGERLTFTAYARQTGDLYRSLVR